MPLYVRKSTDHYARLAWGSWNWSRGAGQWSWTLSGTRPNPPHFVWKGTQKRLDDARAAHAAAWRYGSNEQASNRRNWSAGARRSARCHV